MGRGFHCSRGGTPDYFAPEMIAPCLKANNEVRASGYHHQMMFGLTRCWSLVLKNNLKLRALGLRSRGYPSACSELPQPAARPLETICCDSQATCSFRIRPQRGTPWPSTGGPWVCWATSSCAGRLEKPQGFS